MIVVIEVTRSLVLGDLFLWQHLLLDGIVVAIFTAPEHLEVIAQTGLASDNQFRKIVPHTAKFLREMGQDGVAMLDVAVGIPVASRFLAMLNQWSRVRIFQTEGPTPRLLPVA